MIERPHKAQHIGIVACSAEGAALCYRTIATLGAECMGKHAHPEVSMHTHPLRTYMEKIYHDDWQGVADLMLSSAEKLKKIGADFAICPDNTIHQAFDMVAPHSPLPWLHIAEVVAHEARQRGYKKIGILGTKYTMSNKVYPEKLQAVAIDHVVPDKPDQNRINAIIFDELVYGKFTKPALDYFENVISTLKIRGCDSVVLACTEIPLLIAQPDSSLPTLDSTRLLARAAVERALRREHAASL